MPQTRPSTIARAVPAILVSLFTLAPVVQGADETTSDAGMELMQQQIRELQARVQKLEAMMEGGFNPVAPPEPVPGGWRKQANWALLAPGMSGYRVREILGEPQDETTVNKFEFWEYGDGKARLYMDRLKSWEVPVGIDAP